MMPLGLFQATTGLVNNTLVNNFLDVAKSGAQKMIDGNAEEIAALSSMWEAPEGVDYCRACNNRFSSPFKHHCRSCGGIFCDDCSLPGPADNFEKQFVIPPSLIPQDGERIRLCVLCRRAEGPSRVIKDKVRKLLDRDPSRINHANRNLLEKIHDRVAAKVGELLDEEDIQGPCTLRMSRGSFYGENNMTKKNHSNTVAISGYFEILNKSREVVAVKLLVAPDRSTVEFEIPRPTYFAVPPGQAVYSFFHDRDQIQLIVLYQNPHAVDSSSGIVFDTSAPGVRPEKISPCARIDYFQRVRVYMIDCHEKNVLLKYKGGGLVAPRNGSGIGRVGFLGAMQGKRHIEGMLDFNTNVTTVGTRFDID